MKRKWLRIMALAMSYPSIIFGSGFLLKSLRDSGAISHEMALFLFLFVLFGTLIVMVSYALYSRKN